MRTSGEVWLADPAERHHDLGEHVDRLGAGIPAAIALPDAAAALIRKRQESGDAEDGSATRPVVRVLVDDAPAVVNEPGVAELLERILLTGRQVGVLEDVLAEAGRDPFPGHPHLRATFTRPRRY
jgi:hypothetical protein